MSKLVVISVTIRQFMQIHCACGTFLNSRDVDATSSDGVGVVTISQSQICNCMPPPLIVQIQH